MGPWGRIFPRGPPGRCIRAPGPPICGFWALSGGTWPDPRLGTPGRPSGRIFAPRTHGGSGRAVRAPGGRIRPEWPQTSRNGVPGARRGHPGGRRENGLPDGIVEGAAFVCIFHAVRGSGASDPPRFHALPETPASGCLPATPGGPPGRGPPPAARIVEKHGIFGTPVPGKPQKHAVPENRVSAGTVKHVGLGHPVPRILVKTRGFPISGG